MANVKTVCALVFASALLGSVPLIAVVSHKRNPPEPMIFPAAKLPNGLELFNPEGALVAVCDKFDGGKFPTFTHCKTKADFTLDDVMNAWERAYEDK